MREKTRIAHRYLGFFMAGILAVYALSGIVLIFRDSDTFTIEKTQEVIVPEGTSLNQLGQVLHIKRLKIERKKSGIVYFKEGEYNMTSRKANFATRELPYVLDKMTHFHKAKTGDPLFFLNILFGLSLLFFVVSAFGMFIPGTAVFKKGMFFALGGIVVALVLLFI